MLSNNEGPPMKAIGRVAAMSPDEIGNRKIIHRSNFMSQRARELVLYVPIATSVAGSLAD